VLVALVSATLLSAAHAGPAVTVYTRDLGFIRETRTIELRAARDTVRLANIAERLDFTSVRLVPAGEARVTRLAYRYDVASGDALIDRAKGSRVRVTSKGERVTEGTLVAADGSWLVVRADDGAIHTLARPAVETVRLANAASGLFLRPTLEAVIEGAGRGRIEAELSYLAGGLSWSAEHTVVRRGEGAATWSAAVTVENQTGRDFVDAALKLVAGEPRREIARPMPMMAAGRMDMKVAAEAAPDLDEQSFADYHLYTLDRGATLRDRESQSLTMLAPRAVKVEPRYLYRGGDARGVRAQLVVRNDAASGLGVPLPAGRVRFYEVDPAGDLQFTGETSIGHTAEGEKLTLDVGQAFDLVGERRELYNKRISDREREVAVEVKLRDRKKAGVTIVVEEAVGGDSDVIARTHEFTRRDANTLEWKIPVAAGKETVLGYTVRVRY
jgi:hypothetical protein